MLSHLGPTVSRMSRGSIEALRTGFRARVYAGKDPITGRQNYLRGETRRLRRDAEADVERLLAHVEADRRPDQHATVGVLLDRWTEVVDHELSTASTTAGYVRRTLKPALGEMSLRKLQHRVDILDRLYTHLRRCNRLCDSSPARKTVDGGGTDEPHVCRPMSPGAVRRVHAILSVALNYAVSWGWIERNPADYAHPPKLARRRALPPRPEQVAELLNAAADGTRSWPCSGPDAAPCRPCRHRHHLGPPTRIPTPGPASVPGPVPRPVPKLMAGSGV